VRCAPWLGVWICLAACAGSEAEFHVSTPSTARDLTVSVLGVFRDGKMMPEAWDLGAALVAPIGGAGCAILYSNDLVTSHPELAAAIDNHARANGVTEPLLATLAPATASDAIVLIEISGHPPKVLRTETTLRPVTGQMTKPASPYQTHTVTDGSAFDVDVSAYSVREHRIIAELAMRYTGKDTDRALKLFTERLGTTFPGWKCAAWRPATAIDPQTITTLAAP
jgi:hypothetical protein